MKQQLQIKKLVILASLFGLITLLLFAPCKVRNAVQTAMSLPQTEVSNKSICQVYEDIESVVSVTKTTSQNAPTILEKEAWPNFETRHLSQQTTTPLTDKSDTVTLIPYYILYQNLKVYL